jgi:hypothetical protein
MAFVVRSEKSNHTMRPRFVCIRHLE